MSAPTGKDYNLFSFSVTKESPNVESNPPEAAFAVQVISFLIFKIVISILCEDVWSLDTLQVITAQVLSLYFPPCPCLYILLPWRPVSRGEQGDWGRKLEI